MRIDPQDGGPDDWFVPESDGYPNDWFVPESDGYPNDWFVPASAAPGAAQPAPEPQPVSANPALAAPPAPRPDPLADYWSRVPASRVGAMAWHPPIFVNSSGQLPLTAPAPLNAPWINPTRGLPGPLANLPSAAFPSFQRIGLSLGNGDQSGAPPFLSSLANLPGSPSPGASEGTSSPRDFAIDNNARQGPLPGYGAFGAPPGPDLGVRSRRVVALS